MPQRPLPPRPPGPPAGSPKPIRDLFQREEHNDGSESSYVCVEAETPLIGSATRKTAANTRPLVSRISSGYGAIQEHDPPSSPNHSKSDNNIDNDDYDNKSWEGNYPNDDDYNSWLDNTANLEDDDDKSISTTTSVTSLGSITTVAENFKEGLLIPFTDSEGTPAKVIWGLTCLCVVGTLVGMLMPKVIFVGGKWFPYYRYVSNIIGYNYFVLWSICFYPQVLLNYRRESTKGLSNDFAILNLMGWSFYSAYLSSMYFNADIKTMYSARFGEGESSVQSNDVLFSIHAMFLSAIYVVQIVYYGGKQKWDNHQRRNYNKHNNNNKQQPSKVVQELQKWLYILPAGVSQFKLKVQTWILIWAMGLPSVLIPLWIALGILPYERCLDYFYMLSFFKICCTLTKYSKQAWLNFSRKSTKGWNIWYNFLECSGGTLSMIQIVLDSLDMENMAGITGNLAKFALGLATLFFDGIFFTQHYVLYPSKHHDEGDDDDLSLLYNDQEQQIINGEGGSYTSSKKSGHVRASSRLQLPDMHIPEEIGVGLSLEQPDTESLRSGDFSRS